MRKVRILHVHLNVSNVFSQAKIVKFNLDTTERLLEITTLEDGIFLSVSGGKRRRWIRKKMVEKKTKEISNEMKVGSEHSVRRRGCEDYTTFLLLHFYRLITIGMPRHNHHLTFTKWKCVSFSPSFILLRNVSIFIQFYLIDGWI